MVDLEVVEGQDHRQVPKVPGPVQVVLEVQEEAVVLEDQVPEDLEDHPGTEDLEHHPGTGGLPQVAGVLEVLEVVLVSLRSEEHWGSWARNQCPTNH